MTSWQSVSNEILIKAYLNLLEKVVGQRLIEREHLNVHGKVFLVERIRDYYIKCPDQVPILEEEISKLVG